MRYLLEIVFCLIICCTYLHSEIILDGTMNPEKKALEITRNKGKYEIKSSYGKIFNKNLFHSFELFNIDANETVVFEGININNIISRVTGGNKSYINGIIKSNIPGANLYLINPAGIIFEENASLQISGSFHASTADFFILQNGEKFEINSNDPVLSSSPPQSFGFLKNNNGIISIINKALKLDSKKTLSLISSEINIQNCKINVPEGRINVVAVKGQSNNSYITLTENGFELFNDFKRGNINLNATELKFNDGEIFIFGDDLVIQNKSKISANITIKSQTGGNIFLDVNNLTLSQFSDISNNKTSSNSNNLSGKIIINAKNDILLIDHSKIETKTKTDSNAGSIDIYTKNLTMLEESNLVTTSFINSQYINTGSSGNISINASNNILFIKSPIFTNTWSSGNGGKISIKAKNIIFLDGSGPSSQSYGKDKHGNGGDISLIAFDSIKFIGYESTLTSYSTSKGNAGNVFINAKTLSLYNNGGINARTENTGNAGNIFININQLELNTNALISSESTAEIDGGAVGKISINASGSISIFNNSSITTEAVNTSKTNNIADSGKITIKSNDNILLNDSKITSSVKGGTGSGGDIEISPKNLVLCKSKIIANAYEGNGGNILIVAENFIKSQNSMIEASSEKGIDGLIDIQINNSNNNYNMNTFNDNYLDAASLLKNTCDKRSGVNISEFVLQQKDGTGPFFDDCLEIPIIIPYCDLRTIKDINFRNSMINGKKYFENGFFKQAILAWNHPDLILQDNKIIIQIKIWMSYGYKYLGDYKKALSTLNQIKQDIKQSNDSYLESVYFNCLGDIHLFYENIWDSLDYFKIAYEKALTLNDKIIMASVLNNYANALYIKGRYKNALSYYLKSMQIEVTNQDEQSYLVRAISNINVLRLDYNKDQYIDVINEIEDILKNIYRLPESYYKAFTLTSLSLIIEKIIYLNILENNEELFNIAVDSLNKAKTISLKIKNDLLFSYVLGYLGKINQTMKHYSDAVQFTKRAIFFSQQEKVPESLYLWQWQSGRLFMTAASDIDNSISMYKNSIETLNPIRLQIFRGYRNKRNIFCEKIRNVYLELAEKQLKLLDLEAKNEDKNPILLEVRETIDQLKQSELQNFYKDECIIENKSLEFNLDKISSHTALIYPIVFSKKIVILLMMEDHIEHAIVPINDEFNVWVRKLCKRLRDNKLDSRFEHYANYLYDKLIKPVEEKLLENNINTLVFSPDGILRLLPFSVLHDGNNFLIEKYAVVMISAINLTDLDNNRSDNNKILLTGLSKKASPPLPGVEKELLAIKSIIGNGLLLIDEQFTMNNIINELKYNKYSNIVMATHGVFGSSFEKSYLNIYNGKITVNEMEKLMNISRYRNHKIELLALSACETASGDEQAALGLAGIALKTGVKSIVATLWSVDDEVTTIFMKNFYTELLKSRLSKARAMQKVQKRLISNQKFKHPYYWSPYVLIGNWY